MIDESRVILLVEDNPDDVALTLRAFKRRHLLKPLAGARDGVEARDFLFARGVHAERAGAPLPTLVILDLNLPKMNGTEVLKAIRQHERLKHLPVVILTSSDERRDLTSAYANHANSYIRKPVDHTQFAEAARQLGLYWLVLNVSPPQTTSS